MIKRILLLLFITNNLCVLSQEYSISDIPSQLSQGVNAVIRDHKTTATISAKNIIIQTKYAVTILNSRGLFFSNFSQIYNSNIKIIDISGKLYDKNGKLLKKIKPNDFVDNSKISSFSMYEDIRAKSYKQTINNYPCTIEFESKIIISPFIHTFHWCPYLNYLPETSVQSASLRIITDDKSRFRSKIYNSDVNFETQTQKNDEIFELNYKNLDAYTKEVYSYGLDYYMPHVAVAPVSYTYENYFGDMTSWNSIGIWQNKLLQDRAELPEATKQKMLDLVKNIPDTLLKAKAIYEYMQSKTRYVSIQIGIGGWQPYPADFVDNKCYGDCKALSNYTKALLNTVGIKSYYTLIRSSQYKNYFDKNFPTKNFNHVILCVPLSKDTVWLECTNQKIPFGYLHSSISDKDVLIITDKGGKLAHTPTHLNGENKYIQHSDIQIFETGNANIQTKTDYSGLCYEDIMPAFKMYNTEKEKFIYDKTNFADFKIINYSYLDSKKIIVPLATEKLNLQINNFARKSGNRLFISLCIGKKISAILPNKTRKYDIYIPTELTFIDTSTFNLPENYKLEYLPEAGSFASDFGQCVYELKNINNKIIFYRYLKINKGLFDKQKYNKFVSFIEKINETNNLQFIIVSTLH